VWLPWYRMAYFSHEYTGVSRSDLLYYGTADWRTALPVISTVVLGVIAAYAVVDRGRLLLPLAAGLMSSHAVLVALAARDVPVGKFISGFHFVGDYGATVALAASMAAAIPSAFLSGLVRAFLKDQ